MVEAPAPTWHDAALPPADRETRRAFERCHKITRIYRPSLGRPLLIRCRFFLNRDRRSRCFDLVISEKLRNLWTRMTGIICFRLRRLGIASIKMIYLILPHVHEDTGR